MHLPAALRHFSGRLAASAVLLAAIWAPAHAAPSAYERIYVENCAVCHGDRGDGMSRARSGLNPPPRNFTDPATARELTRERMIRSVTEGRPGTAMVGWGRRLSEAEIAGVVDFVRERFMGAALAGAGDAQSPAGGGQAPPAPHAAVAAAAAGPDLARGAEIYRQNCATCHGDRGAGASWTQRSLDPPPRDFTAAAARAELSLERMLTSVTHGRPGTAMMSFQKRLSPTDIRSVVGYIRSEFMGIEAGNETAAPEVVPQPAAKGEAADMSLPFPGGLAGDLDEGRIAYAENCRPCHGREGDGRGERASFIRPPPRDFLSEEARRTLNRPALFGAIASGKRGTVMPAWKTVMSAQEIADVGEYVFQTFIRAGAAPDGAGQEAAKKKLN